MSDDLTDRIDEALDGTTPGPWFVRPFNEDRVVSFRDEFGAIDDICDVSDSYVNRHEADAALIAAAPSLLAEARDEIARLRAERDADRRTMDEVFDNQQAEIARLRAERAKVTGHNRTDFGIIYGYELGRDDTLAELALLDAPSTGEAGRG